MYFVTRRGAGSSVNNNAASSQYSIDITGKDHRVNRTYGIHNVLYIYLVLIPIFGPIYYYGPP